MWQNVRYALRAARREPGFTIIAVLTLALGIGINTAVFSVVNTVLLRQPPYAEPDRLVSIHQNFPKISELPLGASPAEFQDYRDRVRAFSAIAGHEDAVFDLTGGDEPVRVEAQRVTHTLFSTLGVAPAMGRVFTADEDRAGSATVAVISYEFWQRHFGGDSRTIGSVVRLNEQPYTVIGVMPRGFEFPFTASSVGDPPALWVPMAFTADELNGRLKEFPVQMVAQLRPGISLEQAGGDVERVVAGFEQEHPDLYTGNLHLKTFVQALGARAAARTRPVLFTLAGAVAFVLMIACANVMNLLLARSAARQREIAVRTALGASSWRLTSQLLTEGLLLTAAGAMLGCALAQGIIKLAASLWPTFVSGLADVRIDLPALAFTVGISVVTGILCGLAPAAGWKRPDIAGALRQSTRQGGSRERHRVREVLVVLEAAGAVVLLIGAGLLIHSFVNVLRVPVGFSPDGVVIARTAFNRQRYPSNEVRRATEREITAKLATLPGVTAAALTTHVPLADGRQIGFILEGEDYHNARWADNALVSDDYFSVMGIPLLQGRAFGPQDTPKGPASAIINQSMARRFWPQGDAVGKRILWGGRALTIVGVVGDVHVHALDSAVDWTIYCPVYQTESGATSRAVFLLRTRAGDASGLGRGIREAIRSVDANIPVFDILTMDQVVARSLETRRFAVALLTSFAGLALALAVIGLYGVLSYAVTQRTSELGLRVALGATPRQILSLILGDGLRLTAIGVMVGAVVGVAGARAMSKMLFGVPTLDVTAFALAAATLLLVALIASGIPARRAARVDPMTALRCE